MSAVCVIPQTNVMEMEEWNHVFVASRLRNCINF